MTGDAHLILVGGALLAAAVAASLLASRLRLPALVLFLGVGMAIGSDGLGWIDFNDYALARTVGTVALVAILIEGGLRTGFATLRPILGRAVALATGGTALTALVAGLAAHWLLHLSLAEGLLLGAILSPTDGAAVFALLRGVNLPRRVGLVLEGEAGLNDPVAVMIEVVTRPAYSPLDALWFLVRELGVGLILGAAVGACASGALRRMGNAPSGVAVVATFAAAAIAYGTAGSLDGSGSRMSARERVLVGWAGLRGGVPVVLATLPVIAGVRGSVVSSTSSSLWCWSRPWCRTRPSRRSRAASGLSLPIPSDGRGRRLGRACRSERSRSARRRRRSRSHSSGRLGEPGTRLPSTTSRLSGIAGMTAREMSAGGRAPS